MTKSSETYINLTFTSTDEVDEKGNITRDIPDLSWEHYNYIHNWFIDLIVVNSKHKEVLGGVLEAFFMSFSPIENYEPCFDEEYIEDHIASILKKYTNK
jgi:hypothetical protein